MAQVSNQAQLLSALSEQDPLIQVTAGFAVSSQVNILYPVTIESLDTEVPAVITKDVSYSAYLFRVQNGGSLTLQNIILDGDQENHPIDNADNRSLITVTGGTLHLLEGSVIRNNYAYLEGGGVYLNRNDSYPNTLVMDANAQITGCVSRTSGGGLMLAAGNPQDSFQIGGLARIEGNQAANGGGIYCRSYVQGSPVLLTIEGQVQLTNNRAGGNGGGIFFSGFRNGVSQASSLTLSGPVLISANQAVHGAGIYFYAANTGDRLALSDTVSITRNTASQNGGGCHVQADGVTADLSVSNASVTDNTAGTGGGLYLLTDFGAQLSFSESTFSGNRALNGDSGTGGGIWITDRSQEAGVRATFTDMILENNQATAHAGGMALYTGKGMLTFLMAGGTVANNTASREGGGLVISNEGTAALLINQSVFSSNSAEGSGGGIYYANTGAGTTNTFTMTETILSGNTAGLAGGGMRLSSGTGTLDTLLEDCIIRSNTALSNSGGGIWNGGNDDHLTLRGTTAVTGNSTQAGNGGGIYFNSDNGTMLLTGQVKITDNKANEITTDFGNHGGGICLVPGSLTIQENAEISSNSAGKYGGGISAAEGSQIFMLGGTIQNNDAGVSGGGIWNHGGSTTTLAGGSISNNSAPMGKGIYNDSTLYMEETRELLNGVYLVSADSIVRLIDALTADSAVQLENSVYVIPNPSGTPIVVAQATPAYPQLTQTDADAILKPLQGFDGWDIRMSDDGTQILLAPVSYRIQYENLMGAVNPNLVSYTITTPSIELLPLSDIVGYRFLGWFDAPSGGEQVTVIPQGSSGDLTLYAVWEETPEYYTVTFLGNDACCPKACGIPDQMTVRSGAPITLPPVIPQRHSHCFRIWNTDSCGLGTSYLPCETIPSVNADLYLYAIWEPNPCNCPCPPLAGHPHPSSVPHTVK